MNEQIKESDTLHEDVRRNPLISLDFFKSQKDLDNCRILNYNGVSLTERR